MADDVRNKVRELKRKHNEQAVLSGNVETGLFWEKKVAKDIKSCKGRDLDEAEVKRQREAELERVRARRAQNEAEFAQRQDDIGELERKRLAAEAIKEAAKEEQFYLKQNIERARTRLNEHRAQPIDVLVQVVHLQGSHPLADPHFMPHDVFSSFRSEEIHELMGEVELLLALDVEPSEHKQYWSNVMELLKMLQKEQLALTNGHAVDTSSAMKGPAAELVETALQGTLEELDELQGEVQAELEDPSCVDPEYWQAVGEKLKKRKCQRVLENICMKKREKAVTVVGAAPLVNTAAEVGALLPEDAEGEARGLEAEAMPRWMQQSDGRFSPELQSEDAVQGKVIDEEDDKELLLLLRKQVRDEAETREEALPAAAPDTSEAEGQLSNAAMSQAVAAMGESEDELNFRGVVPLAAQEYWWREKYVPRQPKFFNKVHTGYDWNKYNRAHYDVDNPPPKVVQGYKFNIFFPDLIDKSKAPTYKVLPDPSGDDSTSILRFSAGPPYEDVAFRIVNKEWDRGPKKGFKNVFDRGMLQLYFNFKRTPYKR